ncbi:ATP-binding protein [Pseudomonas gingeri]|uniref:ATP-binding protein n=1 Tax=Pseudomonas gingeri TaxID=117681 RepID=A0A7Y8C0Q1_9PSED|nr:ATP-binding protein [Pseudomonas gingeri]NWB94486.1 ATP-binding protein [Pseudomonas gingeri]
MSVPETSTAHNCAPILHLVCGKIGSGKSTLAQNLAAAPSTLLISEDVWLAQLYPGEITEIADYVRCAGRLRGVLAEHLVALLHAGVSVVLDFPSNTLSSRLWARSVFERAGADHRLHFLDVGDDVCKARLKLRNEAGDHPFKTTEAEFEVISRYFEAPAVEEGFEVVRYE